MKSYALIDELNEIPDIIRNFSAGDLSAPIASLGKTKKLFLTGEGSSRIFPAKHCRYQAQVQGLDLSVMTEGSRQAAEYDLSSATVFGASNSGRTKELIELFAKNSTIERFALTANQATPLGESSTREYVLSCGKEKAVAATKSVFEQTLFYHNLLRTYNQNPISNSELSELAELTEQVLALEFDETLVKQLAAAQTLYFAGRNDGVAEETTLKTNEITRKRSDYLEGTYAVHGIEEAMDKSEVVVVINPFSQEEAKFKEVLADGVGMSVVALCDRSTLFPTINIPTHPEFKSYLEMLAALKLLVAVGLELEIDLDHPVRVRKVGNEV